MGSLSPAKRETEILFVDDDRAFVAQTTAALSLFGYRCFETGRAEDALRLFEKERRIRIVLTSQCLPGMSGLELIKKLNAWSGDRKVAAMLLVESASFDDAVTALRYGAADLLQKPLSVQEIRLSLRSLEARLFEPAIAKPVERVPDPQSTLRHLVLARNERISQEEAGKISDIAWHMLLETALGKECSQPVSVTNLCMSTGAPINTALRHLDSLDAQELVIRSPGPKDKRTTFVHLTPSGLKMVDDFLDRFARKCRIEATSLMRAKERRSELAFAAPDFPA
jgi:DNA-binding response OmpR family regulator